MSESEIIETKENRWLGSIVGLAIGDQLGSLSEMKAPGSFERVRGMDEGTLWTDDTSQALCIADSLISLKKIDLVDQLQRFDQWYTTGYLSCVGWGYGCGPTVKTAIVGFRESGVPSPVTNEPTNGSLMRLSPVPLFYSNDMQKKIAEEVLSEYNKKYNGKIVTKISEIKNYCKAEEYHQKYLEKKF